ncbi:ABC transporter permease [Pleomorphomonas carboxyditropha]|uniref:Glycosyl transferase family 1 n=1 Tax=Pleomorphomonas carboxyditropha TaxID=2023338 RepID=A0A2G9WW55_9HYPH|nr:FtsX-like permease family protein [Pleomorphomonas carboxyditropha]PIO98350.1 glycosyl transferase family 1 [Pleomorphomonas carboxyditropha]
MSVGSPDWPVAVRLAAREARGGLSGFRIFIAAIALGVAAIAAVGSTSRAITEGIALQGREILGGDIAVRFGGEVPPQDVLAALGERGRLSTVTLVNSMARRADGEAQALVRIKAVDDAYPLTGELRLEGGGRLADALAPAADGAIGVVVEPILADRLDVKVGDRIAIGRATAEVRGLIENEPDQVGTGVAYGPRVMMSRPALAATDIVQPGSLVETTVRLALPDGATDAVVTTAAAEIKAAQSDSGRRVSTRLDAAPGLERNVARFSEFLTLVGLTALIVGGVGVTNAVKAFIDRKRDTIATLKAVGAPGGFVVAVYLIEIGVIAGIGVVLGLALGLLPPFFAGGLIAAALDLPIEIGVYPGELLLAAAYGFLTAFAFAIWSLGRAHDVPVSALFREKVAPERRLPRRAYVVATTIAALLLAALAIIAASDRFVAVVFVLSMAAIFVVLTGVAGLIRRLAGRVPAVGSAEFRLALRNIHRRGGLTLSVVLSLGLGLTLMVALALIDTGLRRQLTSTLPEKAPTFFMLDIRSNELDAFSRLVEATVPGTQLETVPMLRGRITALKGTPVDKIDAPDGARWALSGDRGITLSAEPPANSTLASGAWWPKDYAGEPLVSFEDELAREFGLSIGDTVTVSVLGREITARIASTRKVEWQSLSINFVMVFSPNTFAGAPYSVLSTAALPASGDPGGDRQNEGRLIKAVVTAFPTATMVRVKDVLATVNDLIGSLTLAIRAAASIALAASVLVLAGALASGHRQRVYDAVLLKTFGATRARVLLAFALEYAALGLLTAVFALVAGAAAAWGVLTGIMDVPVDLNPWVATGAVAVALLLTIGLGLLGTFRALSAKAAPVLRNL